MSNTSISIALSSYSLFLPEVYVGIISWTSASTLNYTRGPFYQHGLTLIPAWISNHLPGKMWDEITYPFLNFNGATVEV